MSRSDSVESGLDSVEGTPGGGGSPRCTSPQPHSVLAAREQCAVAVGSAAIVGTERRVRARAAERVKTPGEITELLRAWRRGSPEALSRLMPLTYARLKQIARGLARGERQPGSLETTELVHEAYLRLVDLQRLSWTDRAHFYAMSARIMRRVLVDQARRRGRAKRGAAAALTLDDLRAAPQQPAPDILALEDALRRLGDHAPQRARIVELRFFGGLNRDEIAEVMGISSATVTRQWQSARAWLIHQLSGAEAP